MSAAVSTPLRHLVETHRNYGARATARWISVKFSEKLLRLEVSEVLVLDVAGLPPCIGIDPDLAFRFLTRLEIEQFAEDPSNCLARDFVNRAIGRQDRCMASFHGKRLVNYSWYTTNFVDGKDHLGIAMSIPDELVYMYNAFTHPEYRGRRLFSTGVALAAKALTAQGVNKVITTVASSNFASLRSCQRLGFISLGRMWSVGRRRPHLARSPAAARKLGVCFHGR